MSIFNDPSFNADEARMNRQDRLNPPDYAPSQAPMSDSGGIFDNGNNDLFGGSGGTDIFGNTTVGGSMNTTGNEVGDLFSGGNDIMMGNMQQQQPQKSQEDVFWDAMGTGAKWLSGFLKELSSSFGNCTALFWEDWGNTTLKVGVATLVFGIILYIFGKPVGLQLILGGCVTGAVGTGAFLFNVEKGKQCTSKYKEDNSKRDVKPTIEPEPVLAGGGIFEDNETESESFSFADEDPYDADDDIDDLEDEDEYDDDNFVYEQGQDGEDTETSFNNLKDVPQGMYTRQYLWDMFVKVLPTMIPNFSNMQEVDEDDDEFLEWEVSLQDAAEVAGSSEDYLPSLSGLKKNLFTVILTCDRPKGFKPDQVASELANIYAYKDGTRNPNVCANADKVGKNCIITIFTGKSAMISLKDMMLNVKDYMLDSSNYMPVVFGTDPLGKVIHYDLQKLESIIITGMPRSGKSWFVQAVLTQMCAFVSPKELNFYICDPKDGISDFKSFTLPHVKKFVTRDEDILSTLRELVKVEGVRRKEIIGSNGNVNIWDYKKVNPDVDLPIIYVVIDEIVTLASRMDKETNNEFRMLLRELISQMPALGIRAFLIPHVLNNDIIEKKTSDLVPCKISVCGDADHIEKATGSKFKDFPYLLSNKGDMAVKMPAVSASTIFVHGPALTDSNVKNNEIFDYLRRVWGKLEASSVHDSVADGVDEYIENKKMADKALLDLDDEENILDFEDEEEKVSDNNIVNNEKEDDIDLDDFFS